MISERWERYRGCEVAPGAVLSEAPVIERRGAGWNPAELRVQRDQGNGSSQNRAQGARGSGRKEPAGLQTALWSAQLQQQAHTEEKSTESWSKNLLKTRAAAVLTRHEHGAPSPRCCSVARSCLTL